MTAERPAEPRYDRQARREARAKVVRLSRLPPLYDYAQRGRTQAAIATVAQTLMAFAIGLLPVRLITGDWLAPGAAIAVLVAAFAVQAASRYLNAQAGRS